MTQAEAYEWCLVARSAIMEHFPGIIGWLASAKDDLWRSQAERARIADEYQASSKWPSYSPYLQRVLMFCAAILRAVKS